CASGGGGGAGISLGGGWVGVTAVNVAAVPLVPTHWVVPMLGLGNTIGLTCTGIALIAAVRASRGTAALRGSARAAGAGLAGALAGGAAGALVSARLQVSGFVPKAGGALVALASAAGGFGGGALGVVRGGLGGRAGPAAGG